MEQLVDERVDQRITELRAGQDTSTASEFLTIPEAALFCGCGWRDCPKCDGSGEVNGKACSRCDATGNVVNRARIDDLLSQRRLRRYKDGSRTLVKRSELRAYLNGEQSR